MKRFLPVLAIFLIGCSSMMTASEFDLDLSYVDGDEKFNHYLNEEHDFEFYYPHEFISHEGEYKTSKLIDTGSQIKLVTSDDPDEFYWPIYYAHVEDESAVYSWVYTMFHQDCVIEGLTPLDDGSYRIDVQNPQDTEDPFICLGPVGHSLNYHPEHQTVVYYIGKPNDSHGNSVHDESQRISLRPYVFNWLD